MAIPQMGYNPERTVRKVQGWEFAHRFSERIAYFYMRKNANEQFTKKMSDSLICSFLVSEPLFCHEQPERFAHIALLKRGNEQIPHFFNLQKTYKNTILFKNI